MKSSLLKNNLREISKTRRRFLSILVMSFLGVGFFSGLVACGPDMQDTLDNYADKNKLYDINIVSTLGLTDEDINAVKNVEKINHACGIKTLDVFAEMDDTEEICKMIEYNENINVPSIVSGRMPETEDECIIDSYYSYFNGENSLIGKKIRIDSEDSKIKEFTIVGLGASPEYISSERGTATIGNGEIDYFIYVKSGTILTDYYTNIYALINESEAYSTMSEEYIDLIDKTSKKLELIKDERETARYQALVDEANEKLDDAQKEYDDKKKEADEEFKKAENKINKAKKDIASSEKKIKDGENELNEKQTEANQKFDDAKVQLSAAENTLLGERAKLDIAEKEYNEKLPEAQSGLNQLKDGIATINSYLTELNAQKTEIENTLAGLIALEEAAETPDPINQATIETLNSSLAQINPKIEELNKQLSGYTAKKNEIEYQLENGKLQIEAGKAQIEAGSREISNQKSALESKINEANTEFEKARKEIEGGKKELSKGKIALAKNEKKYLEEKANSENKLQEAQDKINDARDDVNKIEKAKWYINKRQDNLGYSNVKDAITTMSNIAKYFPSIFYLIAVLICLTSMTRMIEEERTEIGTLKALGYTNTNIINKYLIYVLLACIIGGITGMAVGFYVLPNIVWSLYSILYTIPDFHWEFRLVAGLEGLLIEITCICLATIYVAIKELKNVPASLMRPRPPKNGKSIMLEKITFIWKRFNFSQKVVARNIFRYKKRALITIIGIAGCTALMVSGFGIKDSVMDITKQQYTNDDAIFTYNFLATLQNTDDLEKIEEYLKNNNDISNYTGVFAGTCDAKGKDRNYNLNIFAIENIEDFKKECNLRDYKTGKELKFSKDGIIITDKIAELVGLKVGNTISVIDSDDVEHKWEITGIAENHVTNYIFMSKEFYEENVKTYKTNVLLAQFVNADVETSNILEEILKYDSILSIQDTNNIISAVNDMLHTINLVVVILVVASAMLDLVVLYNLANINIGERQREIATLKVLGFYNKEVDDYINKENIIFTFLGIALGLVLGYLLTDVIVASVEIEKLKFLRKILVQSYIYSAVITFVFSIIVNFIIHFALKKIDMIESLKSIE